MKMTSSVNTSEEASGVIGTIAKGGKQLPALYQNGEIVTFQTPDEFHPAPFEPSAFNDPGAQRVAFSISPSPSLCDTIMSIDEWCIQALSKNQQPSLVLS